jgi:hypothetical protein
LRRRGSGLRRSRFRAFKGFLLTSFLSTLLRGVLSVRCLVFVIAPLISHVPILQEGYPRREALLLSRLLPPPNLEVSAVGAYPFLPARIRELTGPSLILLEDLMELVKELAIEIHLDEHDLGPRLRATSGGNSVTFFMLHALMDPQWRQPRNMSWSQVSRS